MNGRGVVEARGGVVALLVPFDGHPLEIGFTPADARDLACHLITAACQIDGGSPWSRGDAVKEAPGSFNRATIALGVTGLLILAILNLRLLGLI